jgi:ribosomal protein S18 acetylase RimI-like enzyme
MMVIGTSRSPALPQSPCADRPEGRAETGAYHGRVNDSLSSGVVAVGANDATRAGDLLGRAFHEDPLWVAVLPDPAERSEQLATMFTALVRTTFAAEGVVEAAKGLEAVAVWLRPGREMGLWAMVRAGFAIPRFAMALPADARRRMTAVLRQLDKKRKAVASIPHWYVTAIGVDPAHQGEGLGSRLMAAGVERADREGRPIYLETETRSNVDFYEHRGFEVIEEIVLTGLDLPIWLMIRGAATQPG